MKSSKRLRPACSRKCQHLSLSQVEWTVDVVALDGEVTKARVIEALSPDGMVNSEAMKAAQIPET